MRSLKPEKPLLTKLRRRRRAGEDQDFGIAKRRSHRSAEHGTGATDGTVSYMAHEQVKRAYGFRRQWTYSDGRECIRVVTDAKPLIRNTDLSAEMQREGVRVRH